MAKRWPFSIQGRMLKFSWIMAAKKKQRKIRISNRQCHSKFPRRGSKTKYEKKNLKSGLWPGYLPSKGLLCLRDKQNNRWSLADMELLFSCLSPYQEIITVYILLLDTLLVRCSRSWDNKLNIWREIPYQSAPKYYSLFIDWGQNSRVCHAASIQNLLKVTIFNEFQCVTVARSLSDRFS